MDDFTDILVERWLTKAEHDLITAQAVLVTNPSVTDTVCFHVQQCVEKCLKAFLSYAGVHVEKTHSLPRLVELCSRADPSFDELRDTATELTDYAVTDRYPDKWREIPLDEATEAVEKAEVTMAFVRRRLEKPT